MHHTDSDPPGGPATAITPQGGLVLAERLTQVDVDRVDEAGGRDPPAVTVVFDGQRGAVEAGLGVVGHHVREGVPREDVALDDLALDLGADDSVGIARAFLKEVFHQAFGPIGAVTRSGSWSEGGDWVYVARALADLPLITGALSLRHYVRGR